MSDQRRAWMYTGALVGGFVLVLVLSGCVLPQGTDIELDTPIGVEGKASRALPPVAEAVPSHIVEQLRKVYADDRSHLCDRYDELGIKRWYPRTYSDDCAVKPPVSPPSCPPLIQECPPLNCDSVADSYIADVRGKANRIEELKPFWAAICNLPRDKNGLAPAGSDKWRSWITENDVEGLLERCDE